MVEVAAEHPAVEVGDKDGIAVAVPIVGKRACRNRVNGDVASDM